MNIYHFLKQKKSLKKRVFALLIDPDKILVENIPGFVGKCNNSKVDILLIGGSLILDNFYETKLAEIKKNTTIPLVIFPGNINQVSANADAILYLSLISGRNPEFLIGNQVTTAPLIRKLDLEAISTAYMLIESGTTTSVEFVSGSKPIPRDKPEIAVAHAIAAELLGFKLIYLEAGSGAKLSVPDQMVTAVANSVEIPIIVGGGIITPQDARNKIASGADIIVIGNHFENNNDNNNLILEFSDAIHQ
jgi:putative glycerol-1-phosphate prenyltransferase